MYDAVGHVVPRWGPVNQKTFPRTNSRRHFAWCVTGSDSIYGMPKGKVE